MVILEWGMARVNTPSHGARPLVAWPCSSSSIGESQRGIQDRRFNGWMDGWIFFFFLPGSRERGRPDERSTESPPRRSSHERAVDVSWGEIEQKLNKDHLLID